MEINEEFLQGSFDLLAGDNVFGYVYMTYDSLFDKWYIGKHEYPYFDKYYNGSGRKILKVLENYGNTYLSTMVLQWCYSKEELEKSEVYWIEFFDAVNNKSFYNLIEGGSCSKEGNPTAISVTCVETGMVFESKTKATLYINRSISQLNRALEDSKVKCAGYHWVYTDPEKALRTINERRRVSSKNGFKFPSTKGVPLSDEAKQRISKANKGSENLVIRNPVVEIFSGKHFSKKSDAAQQGFTHSFWSYISTTNPKSPKSLIIYEEEYNILGRELILEAIDLKKKEVLQRKLTHILNKHFIYLEHESTREERKRIRCEKLSVYLRKYHRENPGIRKGIGAHTKPLSEEAIKSISEKNRNSPICRKVVNTTNNLGFSSIAYACRYYGVLSANIVVAIQENNKRTCAGYTWDYFDNLDDEHKKKVMFVDNNFIEYKNLLDSNKLLRRPYVHSYSKETFCIESGEIFTSRKEAETRCNRSIYNLMNQRRPKYNKGRDLTWAYSTDLDNLDEYKKFLRGLV